MSGDTSAPVSLSLTLPLPPSINNQYVTVGKRRVLSKSAKTFKRDVTKHLAMLRQRGTLDPVVERAFKDALIGVYLTFYFETPMRRDLDGGLKIALDSLATDLGFDDRAVVDLHLVKQIDPLHPRLEVELETIESWSFDRSYVYLGDKVETSRNHDPSDHEP
ncbi:MAG: RusA family crossover junction endodeoxyribonuclease [Chloroflexota bacterium]|nr:RusA family crossover junction endodeoxyribonuclease [Chloroflexota bacterium]